MYIKKSTKGSKNLLVIKHLENEFFQKLSNENKLALKKKYIIGLYLGAYVENINYSFYDFIIFADGVFNKFKDDIPRFKFSGFNFLPKINVPKLKVTPRLILYIGDLSQNKNLYEFLRFSKLNSSFKYKVILRSLYISDIFIILLLRFKFKNICFITPFPRKKYPRSCVFKEISRANFIFIPYVKEGAARIFAEAEVLGKSVIYNSSMLGGTFSFMDYNENIEIEKFTSNQHIKIKNKFKKNEIYKCKNTTQYFKTFMLENFNVEFIF